MRARPSTSSSASRFRRTRLCAIRLIEDRCRLFHHFASGGVATRLSADPNVGMAGRCVQGLIDMLEGSDYAKMPYVVNKEAFEK